MAMTIQLFLLPLLLILLIVLIPKGSLQEKNKTTCYIQHVFLLHISRTLLRRPWFRSITGFA